MKAVNLAPPVQRWRLYRLSVIARLDDVPDVRLALRCAASDCGQYPVNERQLPLGLPPIKCMLSFDIRMQQMRAGQLLVALERALLSVPIVLLRLEVMGDHAEAARAGRVALVPSPAGGAG
ncbi:hypothetical protein OR16_03612 [Cupriavidus basilensis OR16]|uniref:Uncharacterized protein n=1 Tax=Cupriavidus basilensis OR16 TaxID=1127483 RepID=H1RZI3_9BURK|nr:hypothetical protein [Cupriavidus basilensis]EHP44325.1 hypothetical protein OR16_03612 [Cupriavidus basilensis OR16]